MDNFIVAIKQHRILGYLLQPYVAEMQGEDRFIVKETATEENIKDFQQKLTTYQLQIIKLADKYSDSQIRKTFGGKKFSTNADFFKSLESEYVEKYIRPSIDKKIAQIIEICKENNVKIFFKEQKQNTLFLDQQIIISKEKAKEIFNFIRSEEDTKYFLSARYKSKEISFFEKAVYVLSDSPCWIITDNRLYNFENINAQKILPFIKNKYISVNKRVEKQYYQKFILNVISSGNQIKASGFEINDEKVFPEAVLSMDKDLSGLTIFTLYFRYNEINFKAGSKAKATVKFFSDQNDNYYFSRLIRDFDFEDSVIKNLKNIFPNEISEGVFAVSNQHKDFYLQHLESIHFINNNLQQLLDAGIRVEQNAQDKNYYTGKINLDFKIKTSEDWFDVYAEVCLEGFSVPFISLKYHILNNIREFQLPNNKTVILKEEWFEKYKDFFLKGLCFNNENFVRIQKYHFDILQQLGENISTKDKIEDTKDKILESTKHTCEQPKDIKATLRDYQLIGLNYLKTMRDLNFGACLADDMGLGKTICTLALLSESKEEKLNGFQDGLFQFSEKTPSLLIVPKSLVYNWKEEAKKFAPKMHILDFTSQDRFKHEKSFSLYDLIITGYATLINDAERLSNYNFNYIILDESQMIKNPFSKTYQSLLKLSCKHRLVLTGTPIENSLIDLWSQMNFINPGILGNLQNFKHRFVTPIEKYFDENRTKQLQELIKPFILRRTKQQVLKDLPELSEQQIICDMTEEQNTLYEKEKSKIRNNIIELMDSGKYEKNSVLVISALTKLRLLACSTALYNNDDNQEISSGKTPQILSMIETIVNQGNKILIFSSFVKHLKLIAAELIKNDLRFAFLTGETLDREAEIKKFSQGDIPVFLISIKAGGTGLNLTQANYVFIIDPWWNPSVEAQAIARAHRSGQKNSVMVYRFLSKDTIEEKIQKYQQKKTDLAENFVPSKQEILEIL